MAQSKQKRAIIIGAGPAGLTAAFEFLKRTEIHPVVLEKSEFMGGLSRTVNYRGNRIDLGGHRFFSKSDRVMNWWLQMMPLQASESPSIPIKYHNMERQLSAQMNGPDPSSAESVMLLRPRKSRIYYLRRLFDYPITLTKNTLLNLGLWRTIKIGVSYLKSAVFPERREDTLEQFFINRFGKELYSTFFKSYTEKVWGVPCSQISAEWGAQRIKGLSILRSIQHALNLRRKSTQHEISQKGTETSLIEQFLYPKLGPGQMWEEAARQVKEKGGEIYTHRRVERLQTTGSCVVAVDAINLETGELETFTGDYFLSSAPIQELVRSFDVTPPPNVMEVSDGLVYRDFITVGLLVRKLRIHDQSLEGKKLISDNWIYIQEPDVLLGRLQIFNNWSPFLVKDPSTVWLGLEYFCSKGDSLWEMTDENLIALGAEELSRIGIIDPGVVLDATVLRVEKAYPAYFGTYHRFSELRAYVDAYENLFLVGRNGMHRYNNQDHSMLAAMMAVDHIVAGNSDKTDLWNLNTEMEYHEEKQSTT